VSDDATWREAVRAEADARNTLYLGPDTPFSPEARKAFHGLKWWPLDESYRLRRVKLDRHPVPRPGRLGATGVDAIQMMEVGVFPFTLKGAACRLLAYSPAPGEVEEDYLLIPFRDGTTGTETYGAGRYLDLEPTVDDAYELDFNRAYHPYCAYDDQWSCTLPPPENRLPVRVEAGERL
jgi:uncharacterized protein (DUF1684 family)